MAQFVAIEIDDDHYRELSLLNCTENEKKLLTTALKQWAADDRPNWTYTDWIMKMICGITPPSLSCPMGTEVFFLNVDGSIYPCFYRMDIEMGNIFEESADKIFSGRKNNYKNLLPELQNASCCKLGCICQLNKK